jgi:oligopeptide transport system ATP-binding protein
VRKPVGLEPDWEKDHVVVTFQGLVGDTKFVPQIRTLMTLLRDRLGMAVIWITHDLGVIAGLAEKVIVMYAGFIVERGSVDDIYGDPRHPYTLALLKSLPRVDRSSHERLATIGGMPPDLLGLPAGCPFAARCDYRVEQCLQENPRLRPILASHEIACWVDVAGRHGPVTGREI